MVGLSTNLGKDIIPRVAGQHGSQPISDIIEVCSPKIFLRPTYAGNAITKVESSEKINFLTFRASNFDEASEAQGSPMVEDLDIAGEVRTSLVSEDSADSEKPDLTTARIVVSGGRGVKSKENFSIISKLAEAFGDAAVGASRAAVDAGYCPNDMQVGQTGKVVAPELYLAFGISGAVQHLAGMKDSKVIVAVNTNPDEPIFEVANYGLEGDLFKVVPELT